MTSRANLVKGTKSGVAGKDPVKLTGPAIPNSYGHTVDTQWTSFSTQGAGVGAFEVLEHAIGIGNEIGRHLSKMSANAIQSGGIPTGGDFWKRVIFH